MHRLLIVTVVALGALSTGCETKQDPTKLPTYKDMTKPENMPMMGSKPGAPPGTPSTAPPATGS